MTIYKNLSWKRLNQILDNFNLSLDARKQFKLNGIIVYCNRVDVYKTYIRCYDEGWEYNPLDYDDLPYSRDVIKYEFDEECKFDLVVDWDWFEIKVIDKR